MRGGIDAAGQTAHDREAGLRQLVGQPVGRAQAVAGTFARADKSQRVAVARFNFTAHIQRQRRVVNCFERGGIFVVERRDNADSECSSLFDFRQRINLRTLAQNGIRQFIADSFHHPQIGNFRLEHRLRRSQRINQRPNRHRPDAFDHVQGNIRFAISHCFEF